MDDKEMNGPSDNAMYAALRRYPSDSPTHIFQILNAAHDPALGLDRSVCLRDVVEALDRVVGGVNTKDGHIERPSALIIREFGGGS